MLDTEDLTLKVEGVGSPTTVILGNATDEAISVAASLCARYSDSKRLYEVNVAVKRGNDNYYVKVKPADEETIRELRIEKTALSPALK